MEFLSEILNQINVWIAVIGGATTLLSIIFGGKWIQARKELREFGKDFKEKPFRYFRRSC